MDNGYPQKLIGFAQIPVTRSRQESQKVRIKPRYCCTDCYVGLCLVPCFKIYHISWMYIDSRNRYQMKVVTKSYIFNTMTLRPFITRMQQPKTQYTDTV